MTFYIVKRIAQGVLMVWLMSLLAFVAIYALGNPIISLINPSSPPDVIERTIRDLGLDQPIHVQYWRFLTNILQGDFGRSYLTSQPALSMILERFPATLELAIVAMLIAAVLGIPLGLYAGFRPGSIAGQAVNWFSMFLLSVPSFWTALTLVIVFAIEMRIFPTGGRGDTVNVLGMQLSVFSLDGWRHLALPAINLAIFPFAMFVRLTAAGVQETVNAQFVKFAHAKGLSARRIMVSYVFRNILVSVITVLGIVFGILLAFAVVTETIFSWPGTGRLIIESIRTNDRPVVLAYLLFTVTLFIVINLLVDIICALVDPRISVTGKS